MNTTHSPGRPCADSDVVARAEALLHSYRERQYRRTDRLFAALMALQCLAGLAAAYWVAPRTWEGLSSQVHPHVWAALFLGGAISLFPIILASWYPGRAFTRHVIAAGQLLMSGLLIHLTGGRLETHFHIFGSLAFLAFYRDWRVLVTASAVTALDHVLRGAFWPQSLYGTTIVEPERWAEHIGWVVFTDVFLILSIRQSVHETRDVAWKQAGQEAAEAGLRLAHDRLEHAHDRLRQSRDQLEARVEERTAELARANAALERDIAERTEMEEALRANEERLRQSEARRRAVLESAPIVLYASDSDGTVTLSEGTGLAALGLKPGELVGRSVFEFSGGDVGVETAMRRALGGVAASYDVRYGGLWLHTELRPVRGVETLTAGLIGVCFDVTERVASEERFRVLFEESSDAHLLLGRDGMIDCNAAAAAMLRCTDKAQVLSLHPAVLSPEFQPDGRRSQEKSVEMDALAHERGFHRFEWTHRKMDGEEFPVEVTLTPVTLSGSPVLLVVWHDLTERKRAEEQIKDHTVVLEFQKRELEKANAELASLATTDGLTGLKNHRAFQEQLAEEVSRAARYGPPLSVMFLDVDRFKQYNDTHGHPAGDAVLRSVGRILQVGAREADVVARYGGEEFVLILPQTNLDGAMIVAERLRAAVEVHPWPLRSVTASFGVAALRPGESGADLIARADGALYASKVEGRNRVTRALSEIVSAGLCRNSSEL